MPTARKYSHLATTFCSKVVLCLPRRLFGCEILFRFSHLQRPLHSQKFRIVLIRAEYLHRLFGVRIDAIVFLHCLHRQMRNVERVGFSCTEK